MARVRFVSWNIENYGTGISNYRRGPGVARLNNFIARVVSTQQVDILGIMEVWPIGVNYLPGLLAAIRAATGNVNWCYDVVKGCVENGVAPGEANIAGPASLAWQSGAFAPRREGYAFFWDNANANFTMLDARIAMSEGTQDPPNMIPVPANAASLTLRGRQTAVRATSPYVRAHGGIDPPNGVLGTWENSYYPESSNYLAYSLYYQRARRPAYVIIELNNGQPDQQDLMPLMIYHAPAANGPAKSGTFMSGMAQELYAIHTRNVGGAWQAGLLAQDNAIAGGDYNARVDDASTWNNCYKAYYRPFGATQNTGADTDPMYDNTNPVGTVVQTNNGFANTGAPIVSPAAANYYRAPIDEMFERIPNIITRHLYRRLRIPELIVNGQALAGNPVNTFLASVNWAVVNHNAATGPIGNAGPMVGPGNQWYSLLNAGVPNDWNNFWTGINQGFMPDARSAALFYRTFISDHLPLMIDFQV